MCTLKLILSNGQFSFYTTFIETITASTDHMHAHSPESPLYSQVASGFEPPTSPTSSNGFELEPQYSARSISSNDSAAVAKPAVAIPPGNTMKMANLFGMRRS